MADEQEIQPLDQILLEQGLKNEDLVKASTEQLTFKQVQKARSGKRVTPNIKGKIVRALNKVVDEKEYSHEDLFTY